MTVYPTVWFLPARLLYNDFAFNALRWGNKVSVVRSLTQFTIVFYEFQFKVGVTLFFLFFTNWSNGQEAEILNDKTLDMKHNW